MTTTDERLGVVTGPREVTFTRVLPGPIERVWAFVVENEKRKLWFAGGEIEPRLGGAVTLIFENGALTAPGETVPERFQKYVGVIESHGRVTRWDPPRGLSFSWWGEPEDTSEVAFDLAEAGDGRVRLTLVHRALKDRAEMLAVCGGWEAHLGVLADLLDGREVSQFWSVVDRAEAEYEAIVPKD